MTTTQKFPLQEGASFDPEFANFDLGLDSLLRAPLDVLNLQIENINVLGR